LESRHFRLRLKSSQPYIYFQEQRFLSQQSRIPTFTGVMTGFRNLVRFNQQSFVTDLQTDPVDFPTK